MRRLLFLTLLGLFSGLLCGLGLFEVKAQSLSQRVTAATGEEEFTLNVINVSLPVTVIDRHGRFISNLEQADFEVFENKRRQPIIAFQRRDGLPLNVAILMDTSTVSATAWPLSGKPSRNF